MSGNDWSDEKFQRLCVLWDEGHSTSEIGRRLGVSKNAVVGKAHREGLPARPSPIKRAGSGPHGAAAARSRLPRAPKTTLPLVGAVPALPPTLSPPIRLLTGGSCCWPIGHPGTKAFRFCEDPSEVGKPYCLAHCKIAFVRVRDLREARIVL